jgi:flagellar biogenesis protein FliO
VSPIASYVVQTTVTLLGVAALAVVFLYGARRAGIGRPSGPLEVVGRLPLDGRRTVYLVRVGATIYVVGSSDAGLVKLGETTDAALFTESAGVAIAAERPGSRDAS